MINPSSLDTNHFHKIAEKLLNGEKDLDRRLGKSTSLFYIMLSSALYVEHPAGSNFLFVAPNAKVSREQQRAFHDIAKELGLEIHSTSYTGSMFHVKMKVSELNFYFCDSSTTDRIRGMRFETVFVDEYHTVSLDQIKTRCNEVIG